MGDAPQISTNPTYPLPPHTSPRVYPHVFLYSTGHTYSLGFTLMVIYTVLLNANDSYLGFMQVRVEAAAFSGYLI
jgi:hypothetical protein